MRNVLAEICARKREHIIECKHRMPEASLIPQAKAQAAPRGFHAALKKHVEERGIGLIAEIKKASPSKGIIRADFDPASLAKAYEQGGASCLSVLTDAPYFQGSDADFSAARAATNLPMIRKDFMLDPYQVLEARALGADCILLIIAALSITQAQELEDAAMELGMDVLIETHDRVELEQALTHQRSRLVGINNRSLKTLNVDLATSESLAASIPDGYVGICESGIETDKDIARIMAAGLHCFLIGESLMRQADVESATRELIRAAIV